MVLDDVEAMVVAFLDARVTQPVSTRIPNPRPATFVRAWRTGGSAVNRVLEQAQITVQGWASDDVSAGDLTRQCRGSLFNDYTAMPLVKRVEEVAGLYYDPDPETGISRYSFTVSLMVRAHR
ncbi:hypothetical protein ACFVU2_21090 [Leifsonia sp. NPDC058194]|uniref:hypothetical protein n=1 Tax=Leifsonia sp. NPDC058194 TaxID=3346374 RepID=UPI0036DE92E7